MTSCYTLTSGGNDDFNSRKGTLICIMSFFFFIEDGNESFKELEINQNLTDLNHESN